MDEIRCLLVEDEQPATEMWKTYLDQVPGWTAAYTATNALDAISYLSKNQVDVIFVDVQLPALSGLDFIQSLPQPPLIVITSAYQEHAVKAFELQVVDYLLKPYSFARFVQTVQRVQRVLAPVHVENATVPETLELLQNRTVRAIPLDSILYIESQREYVEVHTEKETIRSKVSLTQLMSALPEKDFFRIHRSFAVARKAISAYSLQSLAVGGKSLPIGRMYRQSFKSWIAS